MKNSFHLFNISGIPVAIHWSSILLTGWVLLMQLFARDPYMNTVWTPLGLRAILVSIFLHELGQ